MDIVIRTATIPIDPVAIKVGYKYLPGGKATNGIDRQGDYRGKKQHLIGCLPNFMRVKIIY